MSSTFVCWMSIFRVLTMVVLLLPLKILLVLSSDSTSSPFLQDSRLAVCGRAQQLPSRLCYSDRHWLCSCDLIQFIFGYFMWPLDRNHLSQLSSMRTVWFSLVNLWHNRGSAFVQQYTFHYFNNCQSLSLVACVTWWEGLMRRNGNAWSFCVSYSSSRAFNRPELNS